MYFKYLWKINSVFAKCDLQSSKILKKILLLERLQILGEGTAEAARRRERAASAELTARRETQAQLVCMRQGKAILRRGFGLLA